MPNTHHYCTIDRIEEGVAAKIVQYRDILDILGIDVLHLLIYSPFLALFPLVL